MKVALFTDSNVFAGTERHIATLGAALREESVDVSIACPVPSPLAEIASKSGLPVIPIPKRGTLDLGAIKMLRGLLRRGELNVIHAHNGRTALSAAIAVQTAGTGCCLMTQHFLHPNHTGKTGPARFVFNLVHGWVHRNLAHVIAVSASVRDASLARGDVPADRITAIANGLPDIERQSTSDRATLRQSLNISAENILVICVARLQPEKNVQSLVEAMAEIFRKNPNSALRCVIVGAGPESKLISDKVKQQGLRDKVFMTGHRSDSHALIGAADILVLPSVAEPFGLVLLEAMAVGTPVIATRVGGPLEIVQDSVNGLLVPPGDPPALAHAILRLADDAQLRLNIARAGRQRFIDQYTARRMAMETANLYRKLTRQDRTTAALPVAELSPSVAGASAD